jgi:hypothetical protein
MSTADASTSLKLSEGKVTELQDALRKTKAQLADALSELDVTQHEIVPLRKCAFPTLMQLNTNNLSKLGGLVALLLCKPSSRMTCLIICDTFWHVTTHVMGKLDWEHSAMSLQPR